MNGSHLILSLLQPSRIAPPNILEQQATTLVYMVNSFLNFDIILSKFLSIYGPSNLHQIFYELSLKPLQFITNVTSGVIVHFCSM